MSHAAFFFQGTPSKIPLLHCIFYDTSWAIKYILAISTFRLAKLCFKLIKLRGRLLSYEVQSVKLCMRCFNFGVDRGNEPIRTNSGIFPESIERSVILPTNLLHLILGMISTDSFLIQFQFYRTFSRVNKLLKTFKLLEFFKGWGALKLQREHSFLWCDRTIEFHGEEIFHHLVWLYDEIFLLLFVSRSIPF